MMKFFRVLIVLCLAIYTLQAQELPNTEYKWLVNGTGASFPASVYALWIFDYAFVRPELKIVYTVSDSGTGRAYIEAPSPNVTYGASDAPLTESEFEATPDLTTWPAVAGAVVPIYRLPTLGSTRLILSRETLALIFMGRISNWRDQAILDDNANNGNVSSLLPNASIQVMLRGGTSGTTETFTSALNSFSQEWRDAGYGVFQSWPSSVTSNYTIPPITIGSATQLAAQVSITDYSISYVSGAIISCYEVSTPYLINKAGHAVDWGYSNIEAAQDAASANMDSHLQVSLVDADGNQSWPISTYSYLIMRTGIDTECEARRELLKYFVWTLSDEQQRQIARGAGFAPLTTSVASKVIDHLETIPCGSEKLLKIDVQEQHTQAYFEGLLALSIILMVAGWLVGVLMLYFGGFESWMLIFFTIMILVGTSLSYLSIIFWYLVPDNDAICRARMWLACLGITIALAAMFSRTLQYLTVYSRITKGNQLKKNVLGWFHKFGAANIIIGTQFILLIVFQSVDPWKSKLDITDELNYEGVYQCTASNVWLWLETSFFGLLCLFGLYVVYATWGWEGIKTESKWLLIAIYNVIFVGVIIGIISFESPDRSDDTLFLYVALGLDFTMTSLLCAVCVPFVTKKIVKSLKENTSIFQSSTARDENAGGVEMKKKDGSSASGTTSQK